MYTSNVAIILASIPSVCSVRGSSSSGPGAGAWKVLPMFHCVIICYIVFHIKVLCYIVLHRMSLCYRSQALPRGTSSSGPGAGASTADGRMLATVTSRTPGSLAAVYVYTHVCM